MLRKKIFHYKNYVWKKIHVFQWILITELDKLIFHFQLLDCFSLVSVMILSRFCLKIRYKVQHLGGAAVCLLGMVGLVLTDVLVGKNDNQGTFKHLSYLKYLFNCYGIEFESVESYIWEPDKSENNELHCV